MRHAQLDSNSDSSSGRRDWRPAQIFAAALIGLVIAAAAVFDLSGGRIAPGSDPSASGAVTLAAAPAEGGSAGTGPAVDASRPHLERSNEPAQKDPVNVSRRPSHPPGAEHRSSRLPH